MPAPFQVQASLSATSGVVDLTHKLKGSIGNQAMTEQVADAAFKVNGMKGGGGFDCPPGAECMGDQDCDRELELVCGATRTCTPP